MIVNTSYEVEILWAFVELVLYQFYYLQNPIFRLDFEMKKDNFYKLIQLIQDLKKLIFLYKPLNQRIFLIRYYLLKDIQRLNLVYLKNNQCLNQLVCENSVYMYHLHFCQIVLLI